MHFGALWGPSWGPLWGPFRLKSRLKNGYEAPGPLLDYFLDPPKLIFFGSGAPPRGSKSLVYMEPSRGAKSIRVLGPLGAPGGPILGPWRGHFGGPFGAPERHISHEDNSLKQGRRQILYSFYGCDLQLRVSTRASRSGFKCTYFPLPSLHPLFSFSSLVLNTRKSLDDAFPSPPSDKLL